MLQFSQTYFMINSVKSFCRSKQLVFSLLSIACSMFLYIYQALNVQLILPLKAKLLLIQEVIDFYKVKESDVHIFFKHFTK